MWLKKIRHLASLNGMAAHARLKNEFTEDEKYHNLIRLQNFQTTSPKP